MKQFKKKWNHIDYFSPYSWHNPIKNFFKGPQKFYYMDCKEVYKGNSWHPYASIEEIKCFLVIFDILLQFYGTIMLGLFESSVR